MINIPDRKNAFEFENNYYLTCSNNRISKMLAHYELFKQVANVPGAIVECGVFKGASLIRFTAFRELMSNPFSKKIIGFDTFSTFPQANYDSDKQKLKKFIDQAGNQSISKDQLIQVLQNKGAHENIELIEGDILHTVPKYLEEHPELRISLLNLDTDIYEPAKCILEHLYPRIEKGGVLLLDDYGVFPGETEAVNEYFAQDKEVRINKFPFSMTPCYIVKS